MNGRKIYKCKAFEISCVRFVAHELMLTVSLAIASRLGLGEDVFPIHLGGWLPNDCKIE